jgi:hypothetical protein
MIVNRRVEIVVLAQVDNSAGRAIAQLGNSTAIDPTSTPTPTPRPTPTPTPTPEHNLLGPDPTAKTTAKAATKTTAKAKAKALVARPTSATH